MRHAAFALWLVTCLVLIVSCGHAAQIISMDGEWEFTWTPPSADAVPPVPTAEAFDARISVPGQWDDQLYRFTDAAWWEKATFRTSLRPVRYLTGIGWYRRAINAPADWQGRSARLTIGCALGSSHVWLNGEHVGAYDYGVYTPYSVDLSGKLNPGQANELIVSVDNTRGFAGGWAFLGNAAKASGMTRSVTLELSEGPGLIGDVYVRPGDTLGEVVWELELQTTRDAQRMPASQVRWQVTDAGGDAALAKGVVSVPTFDGSHNLQWSAGVEGIQPWSPTYPNLYRTTLQWVDAEGATIDRTSQRFGLRRWSHQGRKLLLNGEPIYLRGDFGAYYYPVNCVTPTSKAHWLDRVRLAKRAGMNYINFAARVCPIELMQAADELGIILQCGDHMTVLSQHRDHYEAVWAPIVRLTRKYPSMCFYGFGGERDYYDGIIDQYQKQYDLIKRLHPGSMVMPQQAIRGIDYAFDEKGRKELTPTPFPHHAQRLAQYTKACDLFGHYSGGAFGYDYFSTPWREMQERFSIYEKPLSIHEVFMGMAYLDPDNAHRYTGRVPPYLYERLREDLLEAGLLHKWRTYYDNSCRLQAICQKYCLEKVRKCEGAAGFEYLGLTDMHFTAHYSTGMLDEFGQVKPGETFEGILRYNNESVLMLDFPDMAKGSINRSYWEKTRFETDVMASVYGQAPIRDGILSWRLRDGGRTVAEGRNTIADIPAGKVSVLRRLGFTWPSVQHTTRLNLALRLQAPGYDLANDWDFWVFPTLAPPRLEAEATPTAYELLSGRYDGLRKAGSAITGRGLRIAVQITKEEITHLRLGGDVLLLGAAPLPLHNSWKSFRPGLGARMHHDAGTVVSRHPVLAGLPHEGWGDWQFYPVLEGASCVLFDEELDTAFDPILERISCAGEVRKQAYLFEKRAGAGRLFVSTCVYPAPAGEAEPNPSCVALMDGIVGYVTSHRFKPGTQLSLKALDTLTDPPPPVDAQNLVGPASGFEPSSRPNRYWDTYGADYSIDETVAHGGKASLRFGISPKQLKNNPGHYTGAMLKAVSFKRTPPVIRLSAWHKTDNITARDSRSFLIFIYITYKNGGRYTLRMPFVPGTHDWQYREKLWKPDKDIAGAVLYIGQAHCSGTAWLDDVYFGAAGDDVTGATAGEQPAAIWHNAPVTLKFDDPRMYRIDDGEWASGTSLRVSREGVTTVAIRKSINDPAISTRVVRIDTTPPVIGLKVSPSLDQEGGVYYGDTNTRFSFDVQDTQSGPNTVAVSVDGGAYAPYSEPLRLPKGKHELRCKAADRAGNVTETIGGSQLTGGQTTVIYVTVR